MVDPERKAKRKPGGGCPLFLGPRGTGETVLTDAWGAIWIRQNGKGVGIGKEFDRRPALALPWEQGYKNLADVGVGLTQVSACGG